MPISLHPSIILTSSRSLLGWRTTTNHLINHQNKRTLIISTTINPFEKKKHEQKVEDSYPRRTMAMTTTRASSLSQPSSNSSKLIRLVSPEQVQAEGLKNFKILDASFHLPNSNRSVVEEFKSKGRLPNAQLFDHETIADLDHNTIIKDRPEDQPHTPIQLPHMQPNLITFKRSMNALSISRDDHILVYDSVGIFSSPRAAWLLNSYGHPKISILDGGLPRWIEENGEIEIGEPSSSIKNDLDHPVISSSPGQNHYRFEDEKDSIDHHQTLAHQHVISYQDLLSKILESNKSSNHPLNLFDARPFGRFLGKDPEPRPGLSSGHIPGSISLPFKKLLRTVKDQKGEKELYTKYLELEELETVFLEVLGNDKDRWNNLKESVRHHDLQNPLIVSCGSGMTACIIWFALYRLLLDPLNPKLSSSLKTTNPSIVLYDESWTGYASRKSSPIQLST